MAKTVIPAHWISVCEAARRLGCNPESIRYRCETGKLPGAVKGWVSRRARPEWFIDPDSLAGVTINPVRQARGRHAQTRTGEQDFNGTGAVPTPTDARPGTEAKMAVLSARVEARQQLHHPKDAGYWDGWRNLLGRVERFVGEVA